MKGDATIAPDGYGYGVRFRDGSVLHIWNGRTQRERAEAEAEELAARWPRDGIVVVRRTPGGAWETYAAG